MVCVLLCWSVFEWWCCVHAGLHFTALVSVFLLAININPGQTFVIIFHYHKYDFSHWGTSH